MYIISFISIFFNLQIYSILQLKNKLRKTKNIKKIIINKKKIKKTRKIEVKAKKTKIKTKIIETSIQANARIDAIVAAAATTKQTHRIKIDAITIIKFDLQRYFVAKQ